VNAKKTDDSYEDNFYEYNPVIKEPEAYEMNQQFLSIPEIYKKYKKDVPAKTDLSIKDMFNSDHVVANEDDTMDSPQLTTDVIKEGHSKQKQMVSPLGTFGSQSSGCTNNVLLKDIVHSEDWPDSTNYWCQWDCHGFEGAPVGIPIKYKDDKFHVIGCFCSLECATSYNFYGREDIDNAWENYNLINMLSNKINYKFVVNPAITRKCLTVFGGTLSIDVFRDKSMHNKKHYILKYPLVAVVEQIEELNETPQTIDFNRTYIPLDKTIIDKIEGEHKEQKKFKTVLEKSMNLKFIT
jgi:hypothetical protein